MHPGKCFPVRPSHSVNNYISSEDNWLSRFLSFMKADPNSLLLQLVPGWIYIRNFFLKIVTSWPYNFHLRILNLLSWINTSFFQVWAGYVAIKIIKVDMTPSTRAEVNQFDLSKLTNKVSNIPELTGHCLMALTGCSSHNLKSERRSIKTTERICNLTSHSGKKEILINFLLASFKKFNWWTSISIVSAKNKQRSQKK